MEEVDNITTTSTDDPLQLSSRGLKTTSSNRIEENKPSKTKKKKSSISNIDKAKMWKMLEDDKPVEHIPSVETGHEFCLNCKSELMVMDDGFPTCINSECGVMCRDVLDFSPEWRFYGADDKNSADPTRCGNPINPLLEQSSYGCKVLYTGKSSYEMRKIGKWTEWQSIPHKEKALYNEFMYISTMAQNAGISKIFIDHALAIHKSISEQQMFRGCNRDGTKAASIYISCKMNGCPRTSHEIARIFQLDKTSATHGCSLAMEILNNYYKTISFYCEILQ
jgi:transcription initiation factor TFIIIB Brf1 subunit/transcription initiation factor TFIIB